MTDLWHITEKSCALKLIQKQHLFCSPKYQNHVHIVRKGSIGVLQFVYGLKGLSILFTDNTIMLSHLQQEKYATTTL